MHLELFCAIIKHRGDAMKLRLKQRIFTWVDAYDIYDENGETKYFADAKIFSIGHKIHVYDKQTGREVGAIRQKLLTWLPKYDVIMGGVYMGTISKAFTLWKPKFHVDYRDWEVDGDFLGWNYVAHRGEKEVLRVSRELAWGDCYAIEYANPADEIPALLLVLAIDAVNRNGNKIKVGIHFK